MKDLLEAVKLPGSHRELVCDFLLVFSRFEFALKHNRYFIEYRGGGLGIDRKRFAQDIQEKLATRLQSREDRPSIQPLLDRPPMQEVAETGGLGWVAVLPFTADNIDVGWLMDAIYRVRNNLFHGGKWPPDPARDGELLLASIAFIQFCLEGHAAVADTYFNER